MATTPPPTPPPADRVTFRLTTGDLNLRSLSARFTVAVVSADGAHLEPLSGCAVTAAPRDRPMLLGARPRWRPAVRYGRTAVCGQVADYQASLPAGMLVVMRARRTTGNITTVTYGEAVYAVADPLAAVVRARFDPGATTDTDFSAFEFYGRMQIVSEADAGAICDSLPPSPGDADADLIELTEAEPAPDPSTVAVVRMPDAPGGGGEGGRAVVRRRARRMLGPPPPG